jgi:hypothetical protein
VSPELRSQIERHRVLLRQLVEAFAPEIERALLSPRPSLTQLTAIGGALHSFYGGVESILRTIAEQFDGGTPHGAEWHSQLKSMMTAPNSNRPALLIEPLSAKLGEYLGFRHIYRTHYAMELRWSRMRRLAEQLAPTLREFEAALDRFFSALDTPNSPRGEPRKPA